MKVFTPHLKAAFLGAASFALFLGVWKIASLIMGSTIILPSPEETLKEILRLTAGRDFWLSLWATLLRGLMGFSLSFGAGLLLGYPAGRSPLFRRFLQPYLTVIHSTPVLAIILIALVWFQTEIVPIFVSFLMAFPVIIANVVQGIHSVDEGLVAMARVYRVGRRKRILSLYLPSILPFIASGASAALGLSWRVVVAAEVLSQPLLGIGTGLQEAKLRLETPRVFAWTAAALILSSLTDKVFSLIMTRLHRRRGT